MANQADPEVSAARPAAAVPSGTSGQGQVVANVTPAAYSGPHATFHGRRVSWVAVSIVMVGFLVGGLALIFGSIWWLFWTGAGLAALGLLMSIATNTFEDWY